MGAFYDGFQVNVRSQETVADFLRQDRAFARRKWIVGPAKGGWVPVYTTLDPSTEELARQLSEKLQADVFWFNVHHSDIFTYAFFREGREADRFNSYPGYFDDPSRDEPEGGHPRAWKDLILPGHSAESVAKALRRDVTVAEDLLVGVALALGCPNTLASFELLDHGDHDTVDTPGTFLRIPGDPFDIEEATPLAPAEGSALNELLKRKRAPQGERGEGNTIWRFQDWQVTSMAHFVGFLPALDQWVFGAGLAPNAYLGFVDAERCAVDYWDVPVELMFAGLDERRGLLYASQPNDPNIIVLDVVNRRTAREIPTQAKTRYMSFCPAAAADRLFVYAPGGSGLWDGAEGRWLWFRRRNPYIHHAELSPDGTAVLADSSGGTDGVLFDARSGKEKARLRTSSDWPASTYATEGWLGDSGRLYLFSASVVGVFDPEGHALVTWSPPGAAEAAPEVRDETLHMGPFLAHRRTRGPLSKAIQLTAAASSDDGRRLVAATASRGAYEIDPQDGRTVQAIEIPGQFPTRLRFVSAKRQLMVATNDAVLSVVRVPAT